MEKPTWKTHLADPFPDVQQIICLYFINNNIIFFLFCSLEIIKLNGTGLTDFDTRITTSIYMKCLSLKENQDAKIFKTNLERTN